MGNLIAVVDVDGQVTELAYDERDSLGEVHLPSGASGHYEYDDRGDLMRATLTRPDGHAGVTDYHHDGLHRLRQIIDYL